MVKYALGFVMSDSKKPRQSLSERIAEQLRCRIVEGEFVLGSCLPSERELARQMGVSRQSINMALERVEAMGLVVRQPGRGTMVSAPARAQEGAGRVLIASQWMSSNWTEHPLILRGVTETLASFGYQWDRHDDEEIKNDVDRVAGQYDGVVFVETVTNSYEQLAVELSNRSIPVAVANLERNDLPVSYTCVDHHAIACAAVQMLIDFGHRRIGYVGYDHTLYFYGKMLAAYRQTLEDADIQVDPELIEASVASSRSLIGYRGTMRMLMSAEPPSAIFAGRDAFAQGACAAIEEAGLVIGRDVSVIGYDDLSWPAGETLLTTFHQPAYDMGAEAVRLLVDRMIESVRDRDREVRVLDAPLVLRRSAGPHVPCENNPVRPRRPVFAVPGGDASDQPSDA
jgi:DNA-binding LacI/PurR family transcriptional regulator